MKRITEGIQVFVDLGTKVVSGTLLLNGANSKLKVVSQEPIVALPEHIKCVDEDARRISLFGCINAGCGSSGSREERVFSCAAFPHYVARGDFHCTIDDKVFDQVYFGITDAAALFWDNSPWKHIDTRLLSEPLSVGDNTISVIYGFVGSGEIFKSKTALGTIAAHHLPSFTSPSVKGFSATNHIKVGLEASNPISIRESITLMYRIKQFTEVCSGRHQGVSAISLFKKGNCDERPARLDLTISHAEEPTRSADHLTGFDMLASPCLDRQAYEKLVTNWFAQDDRRRWIAFSRFSSSLKQANYYDQNRLVSAASLFEWYDATQKVDVPEEIRSLIDRTIADLDSIPVSNEHQRMRAILGTIGSESLQSKILRQTREVLDILNEADSFDRGLCEEVIAWAVKCRNKIVHGTGGRTVERVLDQNQIFLTETLEVLFGFMSLHTAGWSIQRRDDRHLRGFSRYSTFLRDFSRNASELIANTI
ncbi:MAG: hypothetical protein RIB46_13565 [Pseudomonadales bacterium]